MNWEPFEDFFDAVFWACQLIFVLVLALKTVEQTFWKHPEKHAMPNGPM